MSLLNAAGNWLNRLGAGTPFAGGRSTISREDTLSLRPVRNPAVVWESGENAGPLVLVIPRKSDRLTGILAWMFRAPTEKRIELDEFGAEIWRRCDGTVTVEALAGYTADNYKLNRRQAEVSVFAFMKMLSRRRLIGFIQEGKEASDGKSRQKQSPARRRKRR